MFPRQSLERIDKDVVGVRGIVIMNERPCDGLTNIKLGNLERLILSVMTKRML